MAYTLQPLITILEKILNPEQTLWIVDHNKPQLQSLILKATSLQQILDESPLTKIESLETQIRDAAHEAEDIIESHMVDQMLSNPGAVGLTFSTPDLQPVMQQLDSAMEQLAKLVELKTASSSGPSFSRNVDSVRPKAVVGVDGDLVQLRDRLTADQKKLEIVPIVGMGGIGKTTLARKLYEHPYIVSHFKYHAWATVSQDYNVKVVLLSLLDQIPGEESDHLDGKKSHNLKDTLYKRLFGRKYVIVLDDIWSIKFWDEIRMYFPDTNKGSRIVITTRESEVAEHASSQSVQHHMQLLNESKSWNLLRQEVFGDQEVCPDELQGIGEKISRDCGGLPLAINVMGGLLSKVERSIGVWESIAKNVSFAIAKAGEKFSNILYLSYSHLPNHLKPCFLYMGAFPEDYKIGGSRLVQMWMADGLVKSNGNKSLEEEAEGFLKALVERNLIFVSGYEYAKPKFYGMHDLLRDLCIRKSNEDKFLYVGNGRVSNPRRMCVAESSLYLIHDDDDDDEDEDDDDGSIAEECIPLIRSFIIIGHILVNFEVFRLLRVLDVMDFRFDEFPTEILQLVNLRFLAFWCNRIPSGISRLKNLQTLFAIVYLCTLTSEIFEMSDLRHLQIRDLKIDEEDMKRIAPNKLQTVSKIIITESLIRRGFLESIPDIKHLELDYEYADLTPSAVDLTNLHKLETLIIYPDWRMEARDVLSAFKFPSGLRELVVHNHVMSPSVMTTLCALPNLEVLKMSTCEFATEGNDDDDDSDDGDDELPNLEVLEMGGCEFASDDDDDDGEEWEVEEGDEFPSLQVLHIEFSNLVRWTANETNFPRLRHLLLCQCALKEIPSGIGEIPTLQLIELQYCSDSAVASARQIVDEQSENGNYTLQLRIEPLPNGTQMLEMWD